MKPSYSSNTNPVSNTQLKQTSEGLSIQAAVTEDQRNCLLFKKILKEEFLRELEYLWDVANDRAEPRDTMAKMLVKQLKSVTPYIPYAGSAIGSVVDVVGSAAVFSSNSIRDQRTKAVAYLQDELDLHHLNILLEVVAQEAWRRYEHFITYRLTNHPEKGVIPFARVGARRMLEKLSRSAQTHRNKLAVPLNESSLLSGLVEGRSGAWIEGFSNHTLELQQTETDFFGKVKARTISAEDVYARPGLRHFEIQGKKVVDRLFIREKAKHQEMSDWKKMANLLKGDTEAFYQFGFVRFRETAGYKQDPEAGYVIMPLSVIEDRYDFKPQDKKSVSRELQTELSQFSPSILCINKATIVWYLSWMKTEIGKGRSLIDYVHEELKCANVSLVICHEDLTGVNLRGARLNHTDLSGAILTGDLTGTDFSHSYLIGAVLKDVTSLRGASFYQARCEFLNAPQVNFGGADLTQACFDYANLNQAKIAGCKTVGAQWRGANLKGLTSDTEVLFEQKAQMAELKHDIVRDRKRFKEVHKLMEQQAAALDALKQELTQKVNALGTKLESAKETKQTLNQLSNQMQWLLQQQENSLTFQAYCQEEIAQLRQALSLATQPAQQKELQTQIRALQQELTSLKEMKAPISLTSGASQQPELQKEMRRLESQFNQNFEAQQQAQARKNEEIFERLKTDLLESKKPAVESSAPPLKRVESDIFSKAAPDSVLAAIKKHMDADRQQLWQEVERLKQDQKESARHAAEAKREAEEARQEAARLKAERNAASPVKSQPLEPSSSVTTGMSPKLQREPSAGSRQEAEDLARDLERHRNTETEDEESETHETENYESDPDLGVDALEDQYKQKENTADEDTDLEAENEDWQGIDENAELAAFAKRSPEEHARYERLYEEQRREADELKAEVDAMSGFGSAFDEAERGAEGLRSWEDDHVSQQDLLTEQAAQEKINQLLDQLAIKPQPEKQKEEKLDAKQIAETKQNAEAGDYSSQVNVAGFYLNGTNRFEKNGKLALFWTRKAICNPKQYGDLGAPEANLGIIYAEGLAGVIKDEPQAAAWYELAIEKGFEQAKPLLKKLLDKNPHLLEEKEGKAVNFDRIRELEPGGADFDKGVEAYLVKDVKSALSHMLKSVEHPYPLAFYGLGYIYDTGGKGVARDTNKSKEYYDQIAGYLGWFIARAKEGDPAVQSRLASCFYAGYGCKADKKKAAVWFEKAARKNNLYSQSMIGECYLKGTGVTKNYQKAVEWLQIAADRGDADAQFSLGNCYLNGWGVIQSKSEAVSWFKKSAAQGDKFAAKQVEKLDTLGFKFGELFSNKKPKNVAGETGGEQKEVSSPGRSSASLMPRPKLKPETGPGQQKKKSWWSSKDSDFSDPFHY